VKKFSLVAAGLFLLAVGAPAHAAWPSGVATRPGWVPQAGAPLRLELARHLERMRAKRPSPPPEIVEDGAVDLLRMQLEVEVGADGRTVDATAVLTVRTNASTGDAFYLWLDRGMVFQTADASGLNVLVDLQEYPPFVYGLVSFSPAPAAGQIIDVRLTYSGVLACEPYGARDSQYCGGDDTMLYYMASGLFPLYMDAADPYGGLAYELDLTLRTPEALELLVAADFVSESLDATWRTTRWHADKYTSGMNLILLTGFFGETSIENVTPPSSVRYPAGREEYAWYMADWCPDIFAFLQELSGAPFPFSDITVFKLPNVAGFPGTATYGMVYLAEAYATGSMQWFEEILTHEISHLWWGILAAPQDVSSTALMVEGMAITSQYEYIRRKYYADLDMDWVLWTKFHRNQIYLWYLTDPETLPPILLPAGQEWPDTVNEQVVWAYYKTSAFLDLIRVALGDAAFFGAIADYAAACTESECTIDDVEILFEQSSGVELTHLFDTFARASTYVDLELGLTPCTADATPCHTQVTLSQDTDLMLPVELVLEDAAGVTVHRELVQMTSQSADFAFTTDARVVRARVNPRQEIFYRVRSAAPGDVDFDGETDGFDWLVVVLAQRRRAVIDMENPGLYDIDEQFETRLDPVIDGVIDEADLDLLYAGFGAVSGGAK